MYVCIKYWQPCGGFSAYQLPCKCPAGGNRWRCVTPVGTIAGLEAVGGNVFWKLTAVPPSGETILPAPTGLLIGGCKIKTQSNQALN